MFTVRYGLKPYTQFTLSYKQKTCVHCAVRAKSSNTVHIKPSHLFVTTMHKLWKVWNSNDGRWAYGPFTVTWHLAKVSSRRHGRPRRMVSRNGTTRSVFTAPQWRLVASSWRDRSHDLGNSSTATTPQTRKPDLHISKLNRALIRTVLIVTNSRTFQYLLKTH